MIYFIRDVHSGLVKIGASKKPWKRLQSLQTGAAGLLEMAVVIDGEDADEHALHARFAAERVRGEWFRADGLLGAFIRELERSSRAIPAPVTTHGEQAAIVKATGLSKAYVNQIFLGQRAPAWGLALIFEKTGRRVGALAPFSDAEAKVWARLTLAMR